MKSVHFIILTIILLLSAGCTTEFFPDFDENKELLVVDGLLTDQNRVNTIKLSRSMPIGKPLVNKPVKGALVIITDNNGTATTLKESRAGTYSTDSLKFRGRIGSSYSLKVRVNNVNYETDFIEMKPVPPIDSLYYEKVLVNNTRDSTKMDEGCRIYADSWDPSGKCLFFRWDYTETWEYRIPYSVINNVCWIEDRSNEVLIKNTSVYSQARVSKYQINYINNNTDKLKVKYSILVNQYSLNKQEFDFWEKVRNISENVGNLYDITPVTIPGNIRCSTNPGETVHGYFSVSAISQKRLFIKDVFLGQPNFYTYCATDTIYGRLPEEGMNSAYWVIEDFANEVPSMWVITTFRECADCTTEGTKVRPPFWNEGLKMK